MIFIMRREEREVILVLKRSKKCDNWELIDQEQIIWEVEISGMRG